MIEELVEIAKKDKRVNIDFTINNRIHLFSAMDPKNKKTIIFYKPCSVPYKGDKHLSMV